MSSLRSDRERGATAIVVALLMTVILGFAGLAIDLGAAYAKHTELQNGADAAAFAVAQDLAPGPCGPPPGVSATSWVKQNVINDEGASGVAVCDPAKPYQVKVTSEQLLQHWFMPVVGKDSSGIAADATVAWGVPVAGEASLPITFSECSFSKRVDGVDVPINGTITIWMDHPSDPFGDACNEAYPPGGFGWLDPPGAECESEVKLDPSGNFGWGPSKPGAPQPDQCKDGKAFKAAVDSNEPILIPIFDVPAGSGSGAVYRIIKFAAFDLKGYEIHNKVGQYGSSCGTKPEPELKSCLVGQFVEYVDFAEGMELAPPSSGDETIIIKLID